MRILREIVITVVIAVAVFLLLRLTIQSYTVVQSSMEPNFQEGECIIVNKMAYRSSDPERGQVIVFTPPFGSQYPLIKRIIGRPGETVEIHNGKVFINGFALEEDEYISERPDYTMPPTEIPENEYFVLGDNRNNSRDSHLGWTVARGKIIGKAWFVYWPPSKWGIVKHYSPELSVIEGQEVELVQTPEVQLEG